VDFCDDVADQLKWRQGVPEVYVLKYCRSKAYVDAKGSNERCKNMKSLPLNSHSVVHLI